MVRPIDELTRLVRRLVADERAAGLELTIYNPNLDPDGACARTLVLLLERTLTRERMS